MTEETEENKTHITVNMDNWGQNIFYLLLTGIFIGASIDMAWNGGKGVKETYNAWKNIVADPAKDAPKKDTFVVIFQTADETSPAKAPKSQTILIPR